MVGIGCIIRSGFVRKLQGN